MMYTSSTKSSLVTVYVTNYNYAKYLSKSIDSVINQTYKNIELLIIDDGSTDNSKEIIEKYSDLKNIKVIFQKNKGLIVSNNIALRLANGVYIMRLDADDYLDNNAVKLMVDEMENDSKLGLVYPNYFIVDSKNNIINYRERISSDSSNVKDIPAHGACTLFRVTFLKSIGGYDESFSCQDGFYVWAKFINTFKVKSIQTPLFYYRRHSSNLTNNYEKILKTRTKIISKVVDDSEIMKPLAIIPVRGKKIDNTCVALQELKSKKIIDLKIEEIFRSKYIEKIVVTTPDEEVYKYLEKKNYANVNLIKRDKSLARINEDLRKTINNIILNSNYSDFESFITFSLKFPNLKSIFIDSAIKSMYLFQTDSVISVRPDNNRFFKSSENGLIPITDQQKFSRLERDDLYRYCGGIILTKVSFFKKCNQFFGGKNGHVIVDQESSKEI